MWYIYDIDSVMIYVDIMIRLYYDIYIYYYDMWYILMILYMN